MEAKERTKQQKFEIPEMVFDSRSKASLVLVDKEAFKKVQKSALESLIKRGNFVKIEEAYLFIEDQPHGIVVVAANPNRPGLLVFGDAETEKDAKILQDRYRELLKEFVED